MDKKLFFRMYPSFSKEALHRCLTFQEDDSRANMWGVPMDSISFLLFELHLYWKGLNR